MVTNEPKRLFSLGIIRHLGVTNSLFSTPLVTNNLLDSFCIRHPFVSNDE